MEDPNFMPIYFQDEDFRERRHFDVREMIEADERFMEAIKKERDAVMLP